MTPVGRRLSRVLVHDFSGHPSQVQLSRELARRGLEVLHVYCSSYVTGRGRLATTPNDPESLSIQPVGLDGTFTKYSALTRVRQEALYAKRFLRVVASFEPDLVIESNDPLLAKWRVARGLDRARIPWVFWLQDLYSVAIAGELRRRLGASGSVLGRLPLAAEAALLRRAAAVVSITPDYDAQLDRWNVSASRRRVIPNWAPVEEITLRPKSRAWPEAHGVHSDHVVLYAGTLGLKHDPALLLRLAEELADRRAAVVVVSEGAGADWLLEHGAQQANLVVLPFQPYDELPEMLASADVLLTILNGSAGVFSVPSKLLTYLCAGRAVVAAVPAVNLAARVLGESGGGVVVEPDCCGQLVAAVRDLLADDDRRLGMGQRARAFAEANFDVRAVAEQFLDLINQSRSSRTPMRTSYTSPS